MAETHHHVGSGYDIDDTEAAVAAVGADVFSECVETAVYWDCTRPAAAACEEDDEAVSACVTYVAWIWSAALQWMVWSVAEIEIVVSAAVRVVDDDECSTESVWERCEHLLDAAVAVVVVAVPNAAAAAAVDRLCHLAIDERSMGLQVD